MIKSSTNTTPILIFGFVTTDSSSIMRERRKAVTIGSDIGMKNEDWSDENKIVLPELPKSLGGILDGNRVKQVKTIKKW